MDLHPGKFCSSGQTQLSSGYDSLLYFQCTCTVYAVNPTGRTVHVTHVGQGGLSFRRQGKGALSEVHKYLDSKIIW